MRTLLEPQLDRALAKEEPGRLTYKIPSVVSVVLLDFNFQSVRIVRSSIMCTSTGTDGKRIMVRSAITAKTC